MSSRMRAPLHHFRRKVMNQVRLLWPHRAPGRHGQTLWSETSPCIPWAEPDEFPVFGAAYLNDLQKNPDTAYVRLHEDVTIDPKTGLLFQRGRVLWASTDFPQRERTPLFHKHLLKPKTQLEEVIVLHHAWDHNYFHFLMIIAPKLYLAETHGVGRHVPVLVSKRLASQRFFREAALLGLLRDREIIVQEPGQVVSARLAYTARVHEYDLDSSEWICDRLGAKPSATQAKRIYIHRGNNVRRFRNQNELNQLLARHEVIFFDPQQHSLREQIDTVSQAGLLIGAHGAGLTNMMFRHRAPCKVIELLNPSWCGPHYYLMAKQRGHDYHWVLNKNECPAKQASVEADLESIEQLLSADA